MNSDSLNMVSRLGEGHMPCTFFLSEPQLKTTVYYRVPHGKVGTYLKLVLTGTLMLLTHVHI